MAEIPRLHSHIRSGTHLLGWIVWKNFYPDQDWGKEKRGSGHWSQRQNVPGVPYNKIFSRGTHDFWRPAFADRKKRLYIFRDGRDVAVSLWRTKTMINKKWKDLTFSEFLRRELDFEGTVSEKKLGTGRTIVYHWKEHIESWRGRNNVYCVRFEMLKAMPSLILLMLAHFLNKPIKGAWIMPPDTVGYEPHEGRIGNWQRFFSDADLEFFYSIVPQDHWGLFDAVHR